MKVNVLLVDDHVTFRDAFRALLEASGEYAVVGQASMANEVAPLFEAHAPDIVVMDVALEQGDGAGACKDVTTRYPAAKVLMLSAHALHDYVARAFAAGASGYALKSQPAAEVLAAMRKVLSGERYLAPVLPQALLTRERSRRRSGPGELEGLSAREREIFDLVVRGYSNASISQELTITVKTVETHRANINRKLAVHSSSQLLRYAALRGLVSE